MHISDEAIAAALIATVVVFIILEIAHVTNFIN